MPGRIEFGCDYLLIMRTLESRGGDKFDPVADAAVKLFLLQWGFSLEDIDACNKLFFDRMKANQLETDLQVVSGRILDYIKEDKLAQDRLIIQLAAVGAIDANLTEKEVSYVRAFMTKMDLRPSEFEALCKQGSNWSIALNYFGKEYAKAKYNVTI